MFTFIHRSYEQATERYNKLIAQFNFYYLILKFVVVLVVLLFSGKTAWEKLANDELGDIVPGVTINVGQPQVNISVATKPTVTKTAARLEKSMLYSYAKKRHIENQLGRVTKPVESNILMLQEEPIKHTLGHKVYRVWFWVLIGFICLWLLFKDLWYHYKKWITKSKGGENK